MDLGLRGRVAMVMAASKGLGKAVAMGLAKEGAQLSICARDEENLERAASDIRATTGANVLAVPADVTDRAALENWVKRTVEVLGPPQIAVTNVGSPALGNLLDVSEDDWRAGVDAILMSVVRLSNLTVPYFRESKWGRIITMTSAQVNMPQDRMLLSSSIRNAVIGLTKCLSNELAPHGITVNSVLPGKVSTERTPAALQGIAQREGISLEEAERRIVGEVPSGRFGSSEEFADVVVFLASERASWVTGASVRVDGGFCKALD